MKDFEWRKRYAPHGYSYVRRRIDFETLDRAFFPSNVLVETVEEMVVRIARETPYFYDPSLAHTRLSIYPKDIGEDINHLDPLKPRFGIEIEIRQPVLEDIKPSPAARREIRVDE